MRDVSIFAEAGDYTFRVPGEHCVLAFFVLADGSRLSSNRLRVEVKDPRDDDGAFRRVRDVLTEPRVAGAALSQAGISAQAS